MDWQTLVSRRAKKDKPSQGGWNAFLTSWVAAAILNPISAAGFNTDCEKSWFGWPCDEEVEKLREDFATETDGAKQKALAKPLPVSPMAIGTQAHDRQWHRKSEKQTHE